MCCVGRLVSSVKSLNPNKKDEQEFIGNVLKSLNMYDSTVTENSVIITHSSHSDRNTQL